jgi:hypothetical protein
VENTGLKLAQRNARSNDGLRKPSIGQQNLRSSDHVTAFLNSRDKSQRLPALDFRVILTTFSMPDRTYLHPADLAALGRENS